MDENLEERTSNSNRLIRGRTAWERSDDFVQKLILGTVPIVFGVGNTMAAIHDKAYSGAAAFETVTLLGVYYVGLAAYETFFKKNDKN